MKNAFTGLGERWQSWRFYYEKSENLLVHTEFLLLFNWCFIFYVEPAMFLDGDIDHFLDPIPPSLMMKIWYRLVIMKHDMTFWSHGLGCEDEHWSCQPSDDARDCCLSYFTLRHKGPRSVQVLPSRGRDDKTKGHKAWFHFGGRIAGLDYWRWNLYFGITKLGPG